MTPAVPRPLPWVLLSVLAVVPGACGLADYEAKMLAEQERLERFERENKELNGPLAMPAVQEQKQLPEVFLRPPRGISSPEPQPWNNYFYQYKGTGSVASVALAWGGAEKFEKFEDQLRHSFTDARFSEDRLTTEPPGGRQGLTLKVRTAELPERTYHLYLERVQKVAVVYEVERKNQGRVATEAMNLSLNALALGGDAARQRKAYKKRSGAKPR